MPTLRYWRSVLILLALLTAGLFGYSSLNASVELQTTLANSRIAFVSDRDGDAELYMMSNDGSQVLQLTENSTWDSSASWLPDGRGLLYSADRDNRSGLLMQLPLIGRSPLEISSAEPDVRSPGTYFAEYSPDATQIAFASSRTNEDDIYIMNADGSNLRNLTNTTLDKERMPSWSPDGTHLAFSNFVFETVDFDIYTMNADGSDWQRLTGRGDDYDASWSPDGTRIAYASDRDGNFDIFVMNADGSNTVNLTANESIDGSPTWSPDGEFLAFTTNRDGNYEIYVMQADGQNQHNISHNPADDEAPSWSPYLPDDIFAALIPTATPFPVTRTPTAVICPNAPPSRLNVGMRAYVVVPVAEGEERRNLRVRNQPNGDVLGMLEPGTDFMVVGQPQCGDDGLLWWEIETLDGTLHGWSVEGFAPDDYLMIPYPY